MDTKLIDETARRLLERHMATGDVSELREAGEAYIQSTALQEMTYAIVTLCGGTPPHVIYPYLRGAIMVALHCGAVSAYAHLHPTFTPN